MNTVKSIQDARRNAWQDYLKAGHIHHENRLSIFIWMMYDAINEEVT